MRRGAICLSLWLAACGTPPGDPDSGEPDSGIDAGADADAGADGGSDGGNGDGGTSDGGSGGDGGSMDAGSDAGTSDGGSDAGADAGPTGRTCQDPLPLTFSGGGSGGTATATGDTSTATTDNAQSSCGGFSTRDLVYSFTTTRLLNLRASLTAVTSTYRPVLTLRNACSVGDWACGSGVAGGTASLRQGSLLPSTYHLWVDGTSGTTGQYLLNATLEPPDAGDACQTALPLSFTNGGAGGVAFATGSTAGLFDDASSTGCGGSSEPDVAYQFTTTQPLNIQVDVTPSAGYWPIAYLWTAGSCGQGFVVTYGCNSASGAGQVATFQQGSLPAGSYLLWIDGAGGTSGAYSMAASLSPPPQGDACPDPIPLVFSDGLDGGTASATGDTSTMFNHGYANCGGLSARDTVYSFTVDRTRPFTATVTPTSGSLTPVLYLQRSACGQGNTIACNYTVDAGSPVTLSSTVPAGTHYLWIDGAGINNAGPYQLTATLP